jgi:hypothetical protein
LTRSSSVQSDSITHNQSLESIEAEIKTPEKKSKIKPIEALNIEMRRLKALKTQAKET